MKDKEMIEEMASDMNYGCVKHDLWPDDAKEIAKALVILGYRKMPEGAIVIDSNYELPFDNKDECEYWKSRCKEIGDIASKETAKDIIKEFALSPRTTAMIADKYGLTKEDLGEL